MNLSTERGVEGKKVGRSWMLEERRIVEQPAYGPLDSSSSRNEICRRIAVATWDDRRPICVRRPEATGALLMRGPDSSLSLRRGSCT